MIWLGDPLLLLERERDGRDDVGEAVCGAAMPGIDGLDVGVEEVLHHHHRVVALLERLPVEERGQTRERLGFVVDGDRDVLLVRGELVADLLVEPVDEGLIWHARGP